MGILYMVRHGQASFGAEDYDRLSDLGHRQCVAVGRHLAEGLSGQTGRIGGPENEGFAAVLRGTLRRHEQSLQALQEGFGRALPAIRVLPGLDEYDSHALLQAQGGPPLPAPDTPEGYKAHFRRLREALAGWMEGRLHPKGMPEYTAFRQGVADALALVRQECLGKPVLIVSSGGPISTAVSLVLGAPAASSIELNLRMRNSSITEFTFSASRHQLVSFNSVPHLETPDRRHWITHA